MKLGIIGCGMIVQEFLPELIKMDGMKIKVIMSTLSGREQAWKLCKQYGIPSVVTDFKELEAAGIDTVYIAVPNFLHFTYCEQALKAGLHVICEKPLTANDQEAQSLAELAESRHLCLFEAITNQYLGTYLKIRDWLPRIGAVKIVQCQYTQYSRRYDRFKEGEVLPVFDPAKAGGALMDLGLYCLHFVIGLFGRPDKVCYYPNIERGIDTSGLMVMSYEGFQALCLAAKDCKGNAFSMIQGDKGLIRCESAPNTLGKVRLELNDGTQEEFDDGSANVRMVPEFEAFVKAINHNNYDFAQKMLHQSLEVSRVQTEARLAAGICFPGEKVLADAGKTWQK